MSKCVYRFDRYTVDPAARELRRDGELVVLSPKVFDCLTWLIEHRDRAVGRDELAAAVWGKADVADTQLVQALLKARRAIGDSGEEQQRIRTVPRFGYRWVAPVELAADDEAASVATPVSMPPPATGQTAPHAAPAVRTRPHRRTDWRWPAALAAAAVLAFGAGWSLLGERAAPPRDAAASAAQEQTRTLIAVLPAEVATDPDWGWLRLGVMELIADRMHDAGLPVVPSDNVVALAHAAPDAEARLREATDVRWVVTPSAQRTVGGWRVRLALQGPDHDRREVEVHGGDATAAAREAADQLLAVLGASAVQDGSPAADAYLARIRALMLAGQLESARTLAEAAAPAAATPELRLLRAQLAFSGGRFEVARAAFDALLDTIAEADDPVLRGRALNGRGATLIRLGVPAAAERDFDAALRLLGPRGEPALAGQAYTGRGVTRALQDRDRDARDDFARARIALGLAGDTLALARLDSNEGALSAQRGRPADAVTRFVGAADRFERFGAMDEWAGAMINQIQAQLALLQPAKAAATADRLDARNERIANRSTQRLAAYWSAHAWMSVGRLTEARTRLAALAEAGELADDTAVPMLARGALARLALADGQIQNAAMLSLQAVAAAAATPRDGLSGDAWLTLIRAQRRQGQSADADAALQRFTQWAGTQDSPAVAIRTRLAQAETAWSEQRRDEADRRYADALGIAERGSIPADVAAVAVSWGEALIEQGDLETASAIAGRVAGFAGSEYDCALLQARLYRALGHLDAWREAMDQVHRLAGERPVPSALSARPDGLVAAAVTR
ncbi:MAG: hypothetical protein DI564_04220 [Rhodanobacter denitrificans]|uniref:OmpR/PhoB-type domain-containing protein n=1 Tax=Rhodanobacter denitrificans TaxID=666685 RepID=A0A2W5KN76_9GAMM|nr:MAG: hypothetical protein DI564_04220 [Rhodanobacter denitrificans]